MYNNMLKTNSKVLKTDKALLDSMLALLETRSFIQLTVNDLCAHAIVSRATFYAHFNDKYDLLKYALKEYESNVRETNRDAERIGAAINRFIYDNKRAVRNLLSGANDETIHIVLEYLLSISGIPAPDDERKDADQKYVVLSNFLVGGMIRYFDWHIENKFPSKIDVINAYFIDIWRHMLEWMPDGEQDDNSI